MSDEERRQLAAELLPHLATIMRLSRPAHSTTIAWLQVLKSLDVTLMDLINEVKRQEGQQ